MSCPMSWLAAAIGNGEWQLTWFPVEQLFEASNEFCCRTIELTLGDKAVVEQGVETPRIRVLGVRLVDVVELIRELLERHVLNFFADIQCETALVLWRIALTEVYFVLHNDEAIRGCLNCLHEETKDKESCQARRPFGPVLWFQRLGE